MLGDFPKLSRYSLKFDNLTKSRTLIFWQCQQFLFVWIFFPLFFFPPWHYIIGFKLNCQLHQIIVARFADEDLIIDFDNFVRCLIRLETLFSEYRFKSQTLLLFLFTARLLDAESYFRSTFVSITDRIITNVQSLLLPTWQVVLVHCLADTISLSLMGCLHSGTFFFNLGVKCVVINSSLS